MPNGSKQMGMMMSKSGLNPLEYNVVIQPDGVEERSAGGIILVTNDRSKWEVQEGIIDALSVHAFSYADWPEGARVPKVGDRVMFAKFAGALVTRNGVEFRVCKDKDLVAVLDEAPTLAAAA